MLGEARSGSQEGFLHAEGSQALAGAAQGSGETPALEIFGRWGSGTEERGSGRGLGWPGCWLGLVILRGFVGYLLLAQQGLYMYLVILCLFSLCLLQPVVATSHPPALPGAPLLLLDAFSSTSPFPMFLQCHQPQDTLPKKESRASPRQPLGLWRLSVPLLPGRVLTESISGL